MFTLARNLYRYVRSKRERSATLVLVGLDNAGKTTLLGTLRGDAPKDTRPTVGFNTEKLVEDAVHLNVYDLGGGKNIRGIWQHYFHEVHGVVVVVDSADEARLAEVKAVLMETLADPSLSNKPVLIFANKQDVGGALDAPALAAALELPTLKNARYHIVPCVARRTDEAPTADARIKQGTKWVLGSIRSDYKALHARVEVDVKAKKEEEARKKAEKKARVEKMKEERRRQRELEEAAAAAAEAEAAAAGGDEGGGEGEGGAAAAEAPITPAAKEPASVPSPAPLLLPPSQSPVSPPANPLFGATPPSALGGQH